MWCIYLDPTPGVTRETAREGAAEARALLDELACRVPKTTGKVCIDVYVRAQLGYDPHQVRQAAVAFVRELSVVPELTYRRMVEGGARQARLRRHVQPENAAQHRFGLGVGLRRAQGLGRPSPGTSCPDIDFMLDDGCYGADRVAANGDPGGDRRRAGVAAAVFLHWYERDLANPDGRPVAAGLPEAAQRTAAGGAEPRRKVERDEE